MRRVLRLAVPLVIVASSLVAPTGYAAEPDTATAAPSATSQGQPSAAGGAAIDARPADPRTVSEADEPAVTEPTTGGTSELLKTKTRSNQSND